MKRLLVALVTICCVVSLALFAPASFVLAAATTYFGEDLGLGEFTPLPAWPNATNAQADFLSHLVGVGVEDFEGFANNQPAPLNADFGAAGTATILGTGNIVEVAPGTTNGFGRYPTSGTKFWEATESFSIEFSQPIAAFGFFGIDIGDFDGQVVVQLANGGVRNFNIGNTVNAPGGSVLFWGIIEDDPALQFVSATFTNTSPGVDFFAFDDFTIGSLEQVVPGPGPVVPGMTGWGVMFTVLGLGASMPVMLRRRIIAS